MKKYLLTVTVEVQDEVSSHELSCYVREAIGIWGGQKHPNDPLFAQKKVAVRRIELLKQTRRTLI